MSRRTWILALLTCLALAAPAAAAVPSGNLIQNPGAEDQSMAHWTGSLLPVNYGLGAYPSRAIGDQYTGGCYFFSSGVGVQTTVSSTQSIDLTQVAEIATGNVMATLSGYLGGYLAQEDNARVRVDFSAANNSVVGAPVTIGPVTAADRGNQTNLLQRIARGPVPSQAKTARVTVTLTWTGGDNDGYADNLSLSLDGSEGAAPTTICLPDRDGDGYNGGVDCNDANAAIHPGAVDVPDDGVDQDCSGADAVNLDRDGDGFNRPQDCNDANGAIHPGAVDTPGDGIDQDCNLADAKFPHLAARFAMAWSKSGRGTRVDSLKVTKVPSGASVRVRCKGKRCAFSAKGVKVKKGTASAGSLFRGRFLGKGAVVDVVVSQAGKVGQVARYTMRKPRQNPSRSDLCTAPGSVAPRKCAGL